MFYGWALALAAPIRLFAQSIHLLSFCFFVESDGFAPPHISLFTNAM